MLRERAPAVEPSAHLKVREVCRDHPEGQQSPLGNESSSQIVTQGRLVIWELPHCTVYAREQLPMGTGPRANRCES